MLDSGLEPGWLSVAEASRALGISETAVRKRIRAGTIPAREYRGRKEVRIPLNLTDEPGSQPKPPVGSNLDLRLEAARMAGELAELRARLGDMERDRDRWHELALQSRNETRAAEAERAALEREIRLLLAQS